MEGVRGKPRGRREAHIRRDSLTAMQKDKQGVGERKHSESERKRSKAEWLLIRYDVP